MDCIISGLSLYTQSLLVVLAYCLPEKDNEEESGNPPTKGHKHQISAASTSSEPSGGIRRRQDNQPPELRLIDLVTQVEVDKDGLSVSRFERLSSNDYHLGILPAQTAAAAVSSKGALETLAGFGTDVWNAAINPKSLFSSSASIKSKDSNDGASSAKVASTTGSMKTKSAPRPHTLSAHPNLVTSGSKIFIHSPYDCILATRRDLRDHLTWLLDHHEYQKAWELVDEHPEIMLSADREAELAHSTPDKSSSTQVTDDFFEESVTDAESRAFNSSSEREKRRIGELWMKELVDAGDWTRAGQVAGKVLRSADRWAKWVYTFAGATKFDEIADYIPTEPLIPPIPPTIYEVVLGHYIQNDKPKLRDLLERWSPELFDITAITTALENQLKFRDVREDSIEGGEKGRDWRIVMESLAKLHEANGRKREALKCYIRLQDADSVFRLIRDSHLVEAVADDIPSFISLRVASDQVDRMTIPELEEATSEAITLLVDEAQHGLVRPEVVVSQLQQKELNRYTFFYFRGLWQGEGIQEHQGELRDRLLLESKSLLDDFADLAIHLFALFDRQLLMDFMKFSTSYSFEKVSLSACQGRCY
jgi:vacuolar protein sorting-associated protein 41